MTEANPTGDAGASTLERLERYLAVSDGDTPQESQQQQTSSPEDDLPNQEASATDADPPAESEERPASDDSVQDEEPQVSLSDVAKYLGVDETFLDVSEDGGVIVKTKIDGKEGTAKFGDLVKSYQLQGHVDAKSREAAEAQKQLAERVQQFEAYAQNEAQKLTALANIAAQELMQDAASINWNELAENDPAGYVRAHNIFQQRQARVNQLTQEAQSQQAQWQQAEAQRRSQEFQAETARAISLIPEWTDATVRDAEISELRGWLVNKGVNPKFFEGRTDAAAVKIFRDAMKSEKASDQKSIAEKKIRTAPKLVKPGQAQDAKQRAEASVRDLKQNIRNSGGKSGIAEYLMATGRV